MERGANEGMMSFDQSLFRLWQEGHIAPETAIAEADNEGNMRLMIKQQETAHKIEHGKHQTPAHSLQGRQGKDNFEL
jgi:twitching motility protein PilU